MQPNRANKTLNHDTILANIERQVDEIHFVLCDYSILTLVFQVGKLSFLECHSQLSVVMKIEWFQVLWKHQQVLTDLRQRKPMEEWVFFEDTDESIATLVMFSCGTRLKDGKSATIAPRFSLDQT